MNEELAHWRYRVKYLERELVKWQRECHDPQCEAWWKTLDKVEKISDATVWELMETTRYLLEEARYMVELKSIEA